MSDEIKESEKPTSEELLKRIEQLELQANNALKSKERIEEEAKAFKARAQAAESQLSEAEKKKLEDEGKLEELLKKEREERKALAEKYNGQTKAVLREKLRNEILSRGKVKKVDMLLKADFLKDYVQFDAEGLGVQGVDEFLDHARKELPFFFENESIQGTGDGFKPPVDGANAFKTDEEKYAAELKQVKNRKELNELRRKYGKSVDNFNY